MFIKETRSKNYIYLSLAESYREGGKVCHRTVAKLGRFHQTEDRPRLERLRMTLKAFSQDKAYACIDSMVELERKNWGAAAVYRTIWDRFHLDDLLERVAANKKIQFDFKEVVFLEVLSRLIEPCSKLRLYNCQNYYEGTKEAPLQHLYRALDLLAEGKARIEDNLFQIHRERCSFSCDLVFYDVTTLYFESVRPDELREFGYSKDGKAGEVQVVLGLLVSSNGLPITYDLYPGSTSEGHTLQNALKALARRFNVKRVIVVADRGLNSKLNLKQIKDAGYDYLVGASLKQMNRSVKDKALDRSAYTTLQKGLEYRDFAYKNIIRLEGGKKITLNERLFCYWSAKRAEKDAKDRERLIKKALQYVQDPSKLNSKKGARRYVSSSPSKDVTLNKKRILEDEQWDGIYGIQSSCDEVKPAEVLKVYRTLWKIEESFRILKSTLQTRPMFHWTPDRIRGHVMVCFLAFLIQRTLELTLVKQGLDYSPEKARDALKSLEYSILDIEGLRYHLYAPIEGFSAEILKALKVARPKGGCVIDQGAFRGAA